MLLNTLVYVVIALRYKSLKSKGKTYVIGYHGADKLGRLTDEDDEKGNADIILVDESHLE